MMVRDKSFKVFGPVHLRVHLGQGVFLPEGGGLPRGRLRSLGTFSCGCPSGGRRAWDLCPLFVPARTGGNRGDHPELSLGPLGPPFFTTWGSVAGPGGTPMPGNISGPSQTRA